MKQVGRVGQSALMQLLRLDVAVQPRILLLKRRSRMNRIAQEEHGITWLKHHLGVLVKVALISSNCPGPHIQARVWLHSNN
jgi:hypothetical protein